jgi:transposase
VTDDRRARLVRVLLDRHGTTYAQEAGIRLADAPSPLYRLLVLCVLLSARIPAATAVRAATELARAGLRTPRAMAGSTWRQRVEALGRGGYRRFDERTATMLGNGAELVLQEWRGDLRAVHAQAGGDVARLRRLLQEVPGIGPVGSAIFCREVQGVWPEVAPFADDRVAAGARALGLPTSPAGLAALVPADDLTRLVAACVRASLDRDVVDTTTAALT